VISQIQIFWIGKWHGHFIHARVQNRLSRNFFDEQGNDHPNFKSDFSFFFFFTVFENQLKNVISSRKRKMSKYCLEKKIVIMVENDVSLESSL